MYIYTLHWIFFIQAHFITMVRNIDRYVLISILTSSCSFSIVYYCLWTLLSLHPSLHKFCPPLLKLLLFWGCSPRHSHICTLTPADPLNPFVSYLKWTVEAGDRINVYLHADRGLVPSVFISLDGSFINNQWIKVRMPCNFFLGIF